MPEAAMMGDRCCSWVGTGVRDLGSESLRLEQLRDVRPPSSALELHARELIWRRWPARGVVEAPERGVPQL